MSKEIFNRFEMKFCMTTKVYEELIDEMLPHLSTDQYGDDDGFYSITNLYFDTYDNLFHHQNVRKEKFRQKLRIRTYGVIGLQDNCYVEIKKKYNGVSNKRRSIMPLQDAYSFLGVGHSNSELNISGSNPQIMKEIEFFKNFYNLEPKIIISYDRKAFEGKDDKGFRVTFDRNLRHRTDDLNIESAKKGKLFVDEDLRLMEVKVMHSIPLWLVTLLNKYGLLNQKFSKYSTCMASILQDQIAQKKIMDREIG